MWIKANLEKKDISGVDCSLKFGLYEFVITSNRESLCHGEWTRIGTNHSSHADKEFMQ